MQKERHNYELSYLSRQPVNGRPENVQLCLLLHLFDKVLIAYFRFIFETRKNTFIQIEVKIFNTDIYVRAFFTKFEIFKNKKSKNEGISKHFLQGSQESFFLDFGNVCAKKPRIQVAQQPIIQTT